MMDLAWTPVWIQARIDPPPYRRAHNGYHSTLESSASHEKWVEIDLGSAKDITSVKLYPAQPFDWTGDKKDFLWPRALTIQVDGKSSTFDLIGGGPATLPLQARGQKVRIVVSQLPQRKGAGGGDYGVAFAEVEVLGPGGVLSQGAKVSAKDSIEDRTWGASRLTDGDTTSHDTEGDDALPTQQLRHTFRVGNGLVKATLRSTCLGVYEPYLNGKRVGNAVLSPDWTDYQTRVQYQTYDVTKFLKEGDNTVAALIGDGWYAGRLGMSQELGDQRRYRATYGRVPMFAAQLDLTYGDKRTETISTGPDWKGSTEGPYRSADLLDGVVYVAAQDKDWFGPQTPAGYQPVRVVTPTPLPIVEPQLNEPIKIDREIKPLTVVQQGDKFLVDFGQNMPGWVKLHIHRTSPGKVTVRHAEMLGTDGHIYTDNLRGAPCIDRYDVEGSQWVEPKFTYHGFRYAEISGVDSLSAEDVRGVVFHSALTEVGTFQCSNPMLDKLWSNIQWTIRANMMSVPTDCPQRDERLGWMGDMLAFGGTACYFYDLSRFFPKWMQDQRDAQADDGRFPDFAPHPYGKNRHFTGAPAWGDAGVTVADLVKIRYGNEDAVREQLPAIERYLSWIESHNPNHLWVNNRGNDYGDWLNGNTLVREGWNNQGGAVPKDVFATLMWYQSAKLAEDLATDPAQVQKYHLMATQVARAFNDAYVQADGGIQGDTQAGYALALWLGILPTDLEKPAFEKLVENLGTYGGRHTTGFVSTLPLMEVLSRFGRSDLAYNLIESTEFPSWGYSIVNGATTIWERWDGYVKGRGFQDAGMNSFNHWALGSVGQWMFERCLGIKQVGPNIVEIQPSAGGTVTWAKGSLKLAIGKVTCSWKKVGSRVEVEVHADKGIIVRAPDQPNVKVTLHQG